MRRLVQLGLVALGVFFLLRAIDDRPVQAAETKPTLTLAPCRLKGVNDEVKCGTLEVPEDRADPASKKIGLRVAVVPALSGNRKPDPLFILAGGPGQAAADLVDKVLPLFEKVRRTRDLVFVDQRGTGKSNGLKCEGAEDAGLAERLSIGLDKPVLHACLDRYAKEGTDVRRYTTTIAMDDLDDVRRALGYDQINVWGASYGTRAALVYLRQHGDHVRAAVIDGVAPPTNSLMLTIASDGQRAFELIFDACAADATCSKTYPDLRGQFVALLAKLSAQPAHVTVAHPLTGAPTDLTITRDGFVMNLHSLLYEPEISSLLPLIIQRASHGDFGPFVAQAFGVSGGIGAGIDQGMFFSVICAEDAPMATKEARAKVNTSETYFGDTYAQQLSDVCEFWPRGKVDPSYHEVVKSDRPVLLLSGELDPVTPPRRAEEAKAGLSHGTHVIVPGVGHGTTPQGCVPDLVAQFIAAGNADALDAGCVSTLGRPPFFESFAGPTP
ncbi:MAG: alpha/beta fold hydrolase [Deltaproteobacteria bacterium]|nr:alpha/beta fold hydrolase [Deltaproteobacteria bacterium]